MVKRLKCMLTPFLGAVASFAMVMAVNSVNSTCLFLAYQPDVPEELDV